MIDQLIAVAGATVECPGDGIAPSSITNSVGHSNCHCTRCDDTGRVYALPDAVREKCRNSIRPLLVLEGVCDYDIVEAEKKHQEQFHKERCGCEGRGWNPSRDLADYITIPYEVRFRGTTCYVRMGPQELDYTGYGETRFARLIDALARALEAQGAKLMLSSAGALLDGVEHRWMP